jgi:hypothetical protein
MVKELQTPFPQCLAPSWRRIIAGSKHTLQISGAIVLPLSDCTPPLRNGVKVRKWLLQDIPAFTIEAWLVVSLNKTLINHLRHSKP